LFLRLHQDLDRDGVGCLLVMQQLVQLLPEFVSAGFRPISPLLSLICPSFGLITGGCERGNGRFEGRIWHGRWHNLKEPLKVSPGFKSE